MSELCKAMKLDRRRFLGALVAGTATVSLASGAPNSLAASTGPGDVLKVVVYTQAGTVADLVARLVGKTLDERFGQRTIVENMAGAGGIIAADYVRRSSPDGRTLLLGNDGVMAIAPAIGEKLPYDPQRDFLPISLLAEADFILVTNSSKGPHSLDEFIIEARKRPGQINYGSAGFGTAHHLGMELLKRQVGIDVVHVAYKGAPAALGDLISGRIDVALTGIPPAMSHIKAGRLSVLGISGPRRSQLLPDVQPLSDKLPGFRLTSWFGLFAPAGTPPSSIEELGRKIGDVMKAAEVGMALSAQGIVPTGAGGSELRARLVADTEKFSKVAQALKK